MSNTIHWHPRWAIRMALEEDGEKQKDLAQRLGWTESKLSLILSGRQGLEVDELTEIARAQTREVTWYFHPPPNPEAASPLSLDLGKAVAPRYDKLEHLVLSPRLAS